GRVFFVNPAGVYFGEGAQVNVNQLVASALNMSDSDFLNGIYSFAGGDGSVLNSGSISAEQVHLIGKQVTNSGTISCPAGYVVMAAGDRVFLGEPGSEIVLEVDSASLPESGEAAGPETGVLNEGTVEAAGGIIALAAAGDIYSQGISNVGSVSVSTEAGRAGEIELAAEGGQVINTGTIEASGAEGGQIVMEGARVGQFGTVHADGATGDGGNVHLTASDVMALSSESLTTANAGANGNGGEVIAYSPGTALFRPDARIEARGGSESGDGGFIEVSGKEHVEVYGSVDTLAPGGNAGSFLIDPYDVTISNTDSPDGTWTGSPPDTFRPTATGSTINVATLQTNLSAANVVVTTNTGTGLEDGDISVAAAIDYGAPANNNLTLQADNDIFVNSTITAGDNNLTLQATGNVNVNAAIDMTSGSFTSSGVDFTSSGGGTITTTGGDIDIQNTGNVTIGANISVGAV
ncbi:MAG: two-partner secretion domain-containing protein, partial [Planctomycetota bacterium]